MRNTAAALLLALVGSLVPCVVEAQPLPFRVELPISAPEFGPVRETWNHPQVASNGEGYVATWTDLRSGEPRAYAARFRQEGTLLDPLGIHIAPADFAGTVLWSGSSYLLIYLDGLKILSRTLATDGSLGVANVLLERQSDGAIELHAATNGTSVLVTGASIPGLLLDPLGHKLREIAFAWEYPFHGVSVAAAGGTYLVVAGNNQALMQTVGNDGTLGLLQPIALLDAGSDIDVATDGTRFLVVWSQDNLEALLVDANGAAVGLPKRLTTTGGTEAPAVAWRDGEYFVTFTEEFTYQIHGLRVSADGLALSQPARTTAKTDQSAAVAARGSSGVAVWQSRLGGIEAGLFDPESLIAADPFRNIVTLSQAAQRQFDVKLAHLSNGLVAGWIETTPTGSQMRLSRGASSVAIPTTLQADRLIEVLAVNDIVWTIYSSGSSIYVRRFTAALEPIDSEPVVVVDSAYGDPAYGAASVGEGQVLCAYQIQDPDQEELSSNLEAVVMRAALTGIEIKKIAIESGPFEDHTPTVVWDGVAFMVAWARARARQSNDGNVPPPPDDIVSLRVSTEWWIFPVPRLEFSAKSAVRTLFTASAAKGSFAMVWQTVDDLTASIKVAGEPAESASARSLDAEAMGIVGALEPHGDSYVLVVATNDFARKFYLQEFMVLTLTKSMQITGRTEVGTFEAHNEWRAPDVDIVGGKTPVIAYARLGSDGQFGGVSRVFVQQTTSSRRRSVR
jgi:hypothetical protein